MPQPSYCVGIDLGTTYSAAAVYRSGEPRPETLPLGEQSTAVASMVFIAADGSMICGDAAHRRAVTDPRRVVREFKRRIGDDTPLVVGGTPVAAEAVAARFVAWIVERVAEREGGQADRVALTHPAGWGAHKRDSVTAALADHGVTGVQWLSEPEAAAIGYATTERVAVGGTVAVYDLGGGTFDAAIVRKLPAGFEMAGKPVGIERLGGVDFDETVFDHVRAAIGADWQQLDPADPAVQSAVAGLRRECTAAKEALSSDTEVMIPVMLPGHHSQVRLGRAEFEEQIRPAIAETVEALRRALDAAGVVASDLDAVLMVGGSSRIPLITQLLSAELGRPVSVDADPKSVIAAGASIAAHHCATSEQPSSTATEAPSRPVLTAARWAQPPAAAAAAGRPGSRRTVTVAAGLALAASFAAGIALLVFGTAGADTAPPPIANVLAGADVAAPTPAPSTPAVTDEWTGQAPVDTTIAGPRQPMLMVATARPRARTTPRGAVDTSPTTPPTTERPRSEAEVRPEPDDTDTSDDGDGTESTTPEPSDDDQTDSPTEPGDDTDGTDGTDDGEDDGTEDDGTVTPPGGTDGTPGGDTGVPPVDGGTGGESPGGAAGGVGAAQPVVDVTP